MCLLFMPYWLLMNWFLLNLSNILDVLGPSSYAKWDIQVEDLGRVDSVFLSLLILRWDAWDHDVDMGRLYCHMEVILTIDLQ
jgi:hypothetical protein